MPACGFESADPVQRLPPSEPILQEGDTCVICQQELRRGDTTRQLPCGHRDWHDVCFLQWLQEHPSCPICRAVVGESGSDSTMDITFPEVVALSALSARVEELQSQVEDLQLQWQLQALRAHVLQRIALLESDRQHLELQIIAILEELTSFGTQLGSFHDENPMWRCARFALQLGCSCLPSLPARHIPDSDSSSPLEASASSDSSDVSDSLADCHGGPSNDSLQQAQAIVTRLRNAVMRTPVPAVAVFRALAGRSGRMGPVQAARVLQHLEDAASYEALARAFVMLDVDGSGFVEESDWMVALQLPRMCSKVR